MLRAPSPALSCQLCNFTVLQLCLSVVESSLHSSCSTQRLSTADQSAALVISSHPIKCAVTPQDARGWVAFLQQWVAPERFGFEKLDSINYYTQKLVELNKKVCECVCVCV